MRPVPLRGRGPQPRFIMQTSSQAFVEVYDIIHPYQFRDGPARPAHQPVLRSGSIELGAFFYEGAVLGTAGLVRGECRTGATSPRRVCRSPTATTGRRGSGRRSRSPRRTGPASGSRMYDMTPLTRYEVAGAGAAAFLQRMSTNNVDKSVGVGHLHAAARRNRRNPKRYHRRPAGRPTCSRSRVNGPMDFDWFAASPARTECDRCATSPAARAVSACGDRAPATWWQPLCPDDLSHEAFKYFRAMQTSPRRDPGHDAAGVLCRRTRLGDLHRAPNTVRRCGICCLRPGRPHGVIAAGRIAFNSLRIEKGYRLWGTDMTAEHQPGGRGWTSRSG